MICFFNEAREFSKSYSILLENFIVTTHSFITEDSRTNILIEFENMKEFMKKLDRGYRIFFSKIKRMKNEVMYKRRVDLLLKTLYKLPTNTNISLPNCEAWGIDLLNYFREIVPLVRKICSFKFDDWRGNDDLIDTVHELMVLGEKNQKLMIDDLNQIKSYPLDRAIIIISNMCNDTTLYSVGTKYENEIRDIMKYINIMVGKYMDLMKAEGNAKSNNNSSSNNVNTWRGVALTQSLQSILEKQYQFITDTINRFAWFVEELVNVVVDEGFWKQNDLSIGLDNLFNEKLNGIIKRFNSRKLDYASKDLITTALDVSKIKYKLAKKTDITNYLQSKYNLKNQEFTSYYHWRD